jgi:hypothetical protein
MNRILALVSTKVFTRVASSNRYTKGGRIRIGRTVTPFRAGSVMVLAGVLMLASGHCTPSGGEADSSKGAASFEQVAAVRQTTTFGTLGIVDGQTVRLSAVRAGNDDPAALCKVNLNFFDLQGNRQGAGVSADLQPQQAAFFDLSRADIHQETARAQIYAVVEVTSLTNKNDEPTGHVAMSIEVFDELDGRTQIYQGAFALTKTPTVYNCCTICCQIYQGRCIYEIQRCVLPPSTPTCPTCPAR